VQRFPGAEDDERELTARPTERRERGASNPP